MMQFKTACCPRSHRHLVLFAPPVVQELPVGSVVELEDLCRDAGVRMRLSLGQSRPEVRLHNRGRNIKAVPMPGKTVLCVDVCGYPEDRRDRARRALECLAYAFHDWAAREILKQDASVRKLEQAAVVSLGTGDELHNLRRKASSRANLALLASIRDNPGQPLSWHAAALDMALPNVSRGARLLERANWIRLERKGRATFAYRGAEAP